MALLVIDDVPEGLDKDAVGEKAKSVVKTRSGMGVAADGYETAATFPSSAGSR
jgi:hypothetical protein